MLRLLRRQLCLIKGVRGSLETASEHDTDANYALGHHRPRHPRSHYDTTLNSLFTHNNIFSVGLPILPMTHSSSSCSSLCVYSRQLALT